MTAIILLNWNGADDTICCLRSLGAAEGEFFVVVADNGSTDNSVGRLEAFVSERSWCRQSMKVHVLPLEQNYGFARGNNIALEFARTFGPDSYLLLNNDTEVAPDFLTRILEFSGKNPEYRAITPKINYFSDKDRIWNCGGTIRFGRLNYFHANARDTELCGEEYLKISFISGCALFFYPDLLEDGKLLTERFFFGEEDFDFSLRMKRKRIQMACVMSSQIYHKVGASRGTLTPEKIYLSYLCRFIDIRNHFSRAGNFLWRIMYLPRCVQVFMRNGTGFGAAAGLTRRLYADSLRKQGVSSTDYRKLVIEGTYFDEWKNK